MLQKLLIVAIPIIFLTFTVIRGDRLLKERNALISQMEEVYGNFIETLDNVAYQGGFPHMPKPAKLFLSLTEKGLILFDKSGNSGIIDYNSVRNVEKFMTSKERKHKLGLMAYGPLALVFNRPVAQYFFVVKYIDIDKEKNNVLVMVKSRELMDRLHTTVKKLMKSKTKGNGGGDYVHET